MSVAQRIVDCEINVTGIDPAAWEWDETPTAEQLEEARKLVFSKGEHVVTRGNVLIVHGTAKAEVRGGEAWAYNGGTITNVSGGWAWADNGGTITNVSGGVARADNGGTITNVSGGEAWADNGGTITNVSGGEAWAYNGGTITNVSGGVARADNGGTITNVSGGWARAYNGGTITNVSGGEAWADNGDLLSSGANLPPLDVEIARMDRIRDFVLADERRLRMTSWHTDEAWRGVPANRLHECGTSHCLAGTAQAQSDDPAIRAMTPFAAGVILIPRSAGLFFSDDSVVLAYLREREYAKAK